MGGVVDSGVGIGIKTSPCRVAIEKAQEELRQEYDVREQRRRELDFLEKGGNPLDFKYGSVGSLSLQSSSLADRHLEQFHPSDAKGSFALPASPHGDSVESSGRPGPPSISGRKNTDYSVLFDGENEMLEGDKNENYLGWKNNITLSEQSSQMDGNRSAKDAEDSAIVRPYARRNRTRTNRDGARLGMADGVHNRGGQGSSLAVRASVGDAKGSSAGTNSQKDMPKLAGVNGAMVSRTATPESCLDVQIGGEQGLASSTSLKLCDVPVEKMDIMMKILEDDNCQKQPFGNCKTVVLVGAGSVSIPSREGISSNREINTSDKLNYFSDFMQYNKTISHEADKSSVVFYSKDSESPIRPTLGVDIRSDGVFNDTVNIGPNDDTVVQQSESEMNKMMSGSEMIEQEGTNNNIDGDAVASNENHHAWSNQVGNDALCKEIEDAKNMSDLPKKANDTSGATDDNEHGQKETENEREEHNSDPNFNLNKDKFCNMRPPVDLSYAEVSNDSLSGMELSAPNCQISVSSSTMVDKAYEDSVLKEAQIIQAKHKRIAELSGWNPPLENRQRCHWNFVLEEMAWLANDVAQERLWKIKAAAQLGHQIASVLRYRFDEQIQRGKLKLKAHNLAKAVMQFWHSAEVLLNVDNPFLCSEAKRAEFVGSQKKNCEAFNSITEDTNTEPNTNSVLQSPRVKCPIMVYAVEFLRESHAYVYPGQFEAPKSPDNVYDIGISEISWDDNLAEESLFYTVPFGAMETYKRSIEAYVSENVRTGSSVQEEVGTSIYNPIAGQGYQENDYDDEVETNACYMPRALAGSKPLKFVQKKRKNQRLYEQGVDLPYRHYATATQPSTPMERKSANLSIGTIPAKRMRTTNASRQRVLSHFGTGPHVSVQAQAKTEVSSGDTNSYHDDQSSLHGGSWIQKGIEVESAANFEKHVSYNDTETSTRPKKKKAKHLDSWFEPGWQLGSALHSEQQREQSKKRPEYFDSNGTIGLYAQHNPKKPKLKQSLDDTGDNVISLSGSLPCPISSQMCNISNQNKLMRYIGGHDKSRKPKALDASSLHSGPGSPWSLFEDQALVVLVHDMGPNWELVSDVINSTLQFKCIFRKAKECKERHKSLMDKSACDGADSAEDSGSSQSYPSTLPGIPKGSARQLFQRLQGPVEEDTLKEHFDKIIHIAQRQNHRRIQLKNENQNIKQIPVHNSHFVALSQVCPNNLNGVFLAPLDLIETTAPSPSPDVHSLGYQGSHASNSAMQNHGGSVSSSLVTSGVNLPVPGITGPGLGNNMSSSGHLNAPMRDGRYIAPKASHSSGDDQHRVQPYNQMLSNRTAPQSNLPNSSAIPGSDRGSCVLPVRNGYGVNRMTVPMPRSGLVGIPSAPMLNSSSALSSPVVGAQSPVNMHAGSGATHGRHREPMQMSRGGHNDYQQRQIPLQEPSAHVTQGGAQGVSPFNGIGPPFSNQTSSPIQTYLTHSQQQQHQMSQRQAHAPNHPQLQGTNHSTGSQQQKICFRMAKERQLQQQQQRYLQQHQQPQFAASTNLMPHVQSPSQLPMSPSLQNSQHVQSQSLTQSASLPPLTPSSPMTPVASQQHLHKNQLPPNNQILSRTPEAPVESLSDKVGPKPRQPQSQLQQFPQSGRVHPQQKHQSQSSQHQSKVFKGIGRGNIAVHQKLHMDPSHSNGPFAAPGSMGMEKEMMQQGQGVYPRMGINQVQPSKGAITQASNHSQVPSSPAASHPTKQYSQQQMPSYSENNIQGLSPDIPPVHNTSSVPHQAANSPLHMGQLPPQPQQNHGSQTQTVVKRMHTQNRQHMNHEQQQVKSQPNKVQASGQKLVNIISPQAGVGGAAPGDSAIKMAMVASAPLPQGKSSEAGITSMPAQVGLQGSPTLPTPVSEQLSSIGQGALGQRSLPIHGDSGSNAHEALSMQSSGPLPSPQKQFLPQS
ncbi:hypothetical protein SAY86_004118 [Trapa natans]|uniref:Uncharacterized protein n=1 Tax=Trapa natans TaxID=22666 RepID=A0AAN7RNG5_TRANT|nr:hypothetical protein SAY86_004118 [Trapa natans]